MVSPKSDYQNVPFLQVFRNLRIHWGIHDAEYMISLAGSKALWQLNSPGKSGEWVPLGGGGGRRGPGVDNATCPFDSLSVMDLTGLTPSLFQLCSSFFFSSSSCFPALLPLPIGCLFFLSDDEKFLVKTMRKSESKTLIEMLPQYYKHMESNPGSLVTRFYGVYGVKQVHGRTVRRVGPTQAGTWRSIARRPLPF